MPQTTLLTGVCMSSWVYAEMGLLDGLPAVNRVMEYSQAYALYRRDVERVEQPTSPQ